MGKIGQHGLATGKVSSPKCRHSVKAACVSWHAFHHGQMRRGNREAAEFRSDRLTENREKGPIVEEFCPNHRKRSIGY
ncbi:putative protein [Arabidopsis thaliana]|uniref:Uncharacterized protein T14K23_90 n=1 Tax=Arabidopsis thaliana TaxID=3702 RepID=Q9M3F8_ARATH|nr:putative protein [Arabidopsis thaliana]